MSLELGIFVLYYKFYYQDKTRLNINKYNFLWNIMPLRLYNTLSRKKEVFKPLKNKQVKLYTCGPTVYWYQHIGNLRMYLSWDILKRVLKYNNFNVKHVMNITDVGHLTSDADTGEDKIEKAAKKEEKRAEDIVKYYLKVFKDDFKKLNIIEPDVWPRASKHIKEQINMIKILEKKGFTYKIKDGIYFDTSKLKDYGKLAKLKKEGLKEGKRIDKGEKRNKTDFALWKFSKQPSKRQQEWKSPWGIGYPGWHLECSAMSSKYLGKQFDIHTGGQEHIPVHHTNEIAQSESAFGKKPWVKYWMHGAWLLFKGEKVSKSKGGLYTISELEKKGFDALDYRYFCLNKQYGKPLNFSLKNLEFARNTRKRLKEIISKIKNSREKKNKKNVEAAKKQFLEIINDDINTPKALSFLWDVLRSDKLNNAEKYELVIEFDKIFGLDLDKEEKISIPIEIKKLIAKRQTARKNKDFTTADKLREKIKSKGYYINDTEHGAKVRKL